MWHLQELHTKYQDKGLVILGFNCCDDKKIALEFLAENKATFPCILDSSDEAMKVDSQDYRGSGVPLNYIIDREGKVIDAWYGYEEGHPRALEALKKAGGELAKAIRQEESGEEAGSDEATESEKVAKSAEAVAAAAQKLFQAIRGADYDHDWFGTNDWRQFPAKDVDYNVDHNAPGWVRWVCTKFKANPISEVRLGKVFAGPDGMPTVHFELQLKDGEILQGDLPFKWDSHRNQWVGVKGLDWHLSKEPEPER